jgi:hypothetical protein
MVYKEEQILKESGIKKLVDLGLTEAELRAMGLTSNGDN